MRVKLAIALAALAAATIPAAGRAGAEPPFIIHFKGRAAQATLTDCELVDPDGTVCMAADIFVSIERYQERGSKSPFSFVDIIFFEVLIDSTAAGGFTATPVAAAFSTDADLSVARDLSSASVNDSDIDLFLCEVENDELICDVAGGTTSIDVAWTASGGRETSTYHELGTHDSLAFNFHAVDASRSATAGGTVGGESLHDTPLFPPSIFTANNGVVERSVD